MKIIETKGITYLGKFDACTEWYWGTDYASGDFYEAEEVFNMGKRFEPNRLVFIHYPDGKVYEPIQVKENQYFGNPEFVDGDIYFLLADFEKKIIQLMRCSKDMMIVSVITEIPFHEVEDFYNLKVDGSPVMITRQGGDERFQIIWPEKVDFPMGVRESFLFKEDDKLIFSEWYEEPEYGENVNVRAYPSGNLIEKIPGSINRMPNEQHWILR